MYCFFAEIARKWAKKREVANLKCEFGSVTTGYHRQAAHQMKALDLNFRSAWVYTAFLHVPI